MIKYIMTLYSWSLASWSKKLSIINTPSLGLDGSTPLLLLTTPSAFITTPPSLATPPSNIPTIILVRSPLILDKGFNDWQVEFKPFLLPFKQATPLPDEAFSHSNTHLFGGWLVKTRDWRGWGLIKRGTLMSGSY